MTGTDQCSRPDCEGEVLHRRLCKPHYVKARATGAFAKVPLAPVRAHVRRLRELGWSNRSIAQTAGISVHSVTQINAGRYRSGTVRQSTAAAVLAVPVGPCRSRRGVDPTIASRKVCALLRLGHPMRDIAEATGLKESHLAEIRMGRRALSFLAAGMVDDGYRKLWSTPGRSAVTATKAARRGYLGPAAWDDIDDPDEVPSRVDRRDDLPDEVVVRRLLAGQPTRSRTPDRIEAVRQLAAAGAGTGTISDRLRMSGARVHQILGLLGQGRSTTAGAGTSTREAA